MIKNLFQCPIELFEAYPIGRILNRLSCDMYVVDQVEIENIMFSVFFSISKLRKLIEKLFRNFPLVSRD